MGWRQVYLHTTCRLHRTSQPQPIFYFRQPATPRVPFARCSPCFRWVCARATCTQLQRNMEPNMSRQADSHNQIPHTPPLTFLHAPYSVRAPTHQPKHQRTGETHTCTREKGASQFVGSNMSNGSCSSSTPY